MIFFETKNTGSKNNLPYMFELLKCEFNSDIDKSELNVKNSVQTHKIFLGIPDDDNILCSSLAFSQFNSVDDIINNKYFNNNYKNIIKQIHKELSNNDIIVTFNGDDTLLSNMNLLFEKYNLPIINFNSLDILKLIRKKIDINDIGNTLFLTVLIYLFPKHVQQIKTTYNNYKTIFLLKELFIKIKTIYNINSFQDFKTIINTPMIIKDFQFGKYKGYSIKDIAEKDPQYLYWIYNNETMKEKFPDLFYTISLIINKDISE